MKKIINLLFFVFCVTMITGVICLANESKKEIISINDVDAQNVPQSFVQDANTSFFNID